MANPTTVIKDIKCLPPRGNFIAWEVQDPPTTGSPVFKIERAESPAGPWTEAQTVTNNFNYFDNIPVHRIGIDWYYRVTLQGQTNCEATSKPVTRRLLNTHLTRRLRGEINKMRFDVSTMLTKDNGVPIQIFKKITRGPRCTECVSKVSKLQTNTLCAQCFGTGKDKGFFAPVRTLGFINTSGTQESIDVGGETESEMARLIMLEFPLLTADDVVVELGRGNVYEVKQVTYTERHRVIVHQEPTISLLPRSHPYYALTNGINTGRLGTETFVFTKAFEKTIR